MRILILEDNPNKYEKTVDYITNVSSDNVKIDLGESVAEAVRLLEGNISYDRIVIDMQVPVQEDGYIDREGGITFLQTLDELGIDAKRIVNSSSDETRNVLDNNGYENETLIVNSSMYDCSEEFKKFMND